MILVCFFGFLIGLMGEFLGFVCWLGWWFCMSFCCVGCLGGDGFWSDLRFLLEEGDEGDSEV